MKNRVRYYRSFEDDFFQSGETHTLPPDYKWIRKDIVSKILSAIIYTFAVIFSNVYCRFFLHVKVRGADKLRKHKDGYFLYANHTQPIGDVFTPALVCFPKRIYTVVGAANMDLPVIGKILPFLGALPIPGSLKGMKEFNNAVQTRVNDGHPIIIYPEAHLWEYYTKIRPFSDVSFKYPVKSGKAVFSMPSTYQKRKFGKKPKTTVFIDGPFTPEGEALKEKTKSLKDAVFESMQKRSELSTCEYIKYIYTEN